MQKKAGGLGAKDPESVGRGPIHEVMSFSPQDREYVPVISQVGIGAATKLAAGARGPTVITASATMSALARIETREERIASVKSHEVK